MVERQVLVTGASGFIGSHLVEELISRGFRVRALVRPASRVGFVPAGAEPVAGDVTRPAGLPAAVAGVRAVYHVAGVISTLREEEFERVNVAGAASLARAAVKAAPDCERFVLVSSLAASGPSRSGVPARETDRPRPVSRYGRSKLDGERAVIAGAGGIPVTIVRPPIVYGPRDRGLLTLFQIAERGLAPMFRPEKYYSLCHVRDLVRGIADAGEAAVAAGRVYHLAEARAWSASALIAEIARTVGRRPRLLPVPEALLRLLGPLADRIRADFGLGGRAFGDKVREILPRFWIADVSRAREDFGFRARIDLGEGLSETAAFYRRVGWIGPAGAATAEVGSRSG
jgi:nucleoside-diphosphate-sugar epimerase